MVVVAIRDLLGQVEIVPANDAVLHQAPAGLRDSLLLLFGLYKLPWTPYRNRPRETMGLLNLAELVLDRLAQRDIIQVAKDDLRPKRSEAYVALRTFVGIEPTGKNRRCDGMCGSQMVPGWPFHCLSQQPGQDARNGCCGRHFEKNPGNAATRQDGDLQLEP